MSVRFVVGDSLAVLRSMPAASVDLILTSPPFLALRSYLPADHPEKHHEIGSEATPAEFLDVLLDCTEEWARVLAPHGSICVELGDTYSGAGGYGSADSPNPAYGDGARFAERYEGRTARRFKTKDDGWPLDKSLTCIPVLYEASLAYGRNLLNGRQTDPWRVRNLIAWVRPNPPVGALGDKVRPATSYLTWACKARDRWFDLDSVRGPLAHDYEGKKPGGDREFDRNEAKARVNGPRTVIASPEGAPPLDWWKIVPGGSSRAHYAVFPEELCVIPIQASCPRRVCLSCGKPSRRMVGETHYIKPNGRDHDALAMREGRRVAGGVNQWTVPGSDTGNFVRDAPTTGWTSCGCPGTNRLRLDGFHDGDGWRPGVVLDPFAGSGTTLAVAQGHGRDAIGIDLDERNADLARERLGMFLDVTPR